MKIRKSLSTKIILMVVALLVLSSGLFCAISVYRARFGIRQAIQQRMVDIANCAAGSVNGDILKDLQAGDEDTPEYRKIYDAMAVFRDNVELEYIYGIRDEGNGRFTFTVDVDLKDPADFGDEVKYTEALNMAAQGKTAVDEVPYSDKWGSFYSAYSPVFDSTGQVAGIVAADFSEAWFNAQLQEQTRTTVRSYIVILLITIAGAVALCMATLRPYVRQQEQLLKEKVTAESANQAKSEFLANMSHEIRTPINAMLGMNEMILRESMQGKELPGGRTEKTRKAFEQIGGYAHEVERAGNSLLGIVNDILDFSRIETGKMELVQAPYRLSAVLRDVSSMILFRAEEKGLTFTLDAEEEMPDRLTGDEKRIREIVSNLLDNAVKYTPHGYVRMTVRAAKEQENTLQLKFTVEDSGIGIRQEDMEKLFTKFQRLDMERNSTTEGSGLGLVITQHLVDMMGGTIEVQSEYGKGSTFTVTIPQGIAAEDDGDEAGMQAEKTPGTAAYRESFHAPGARVLLVDDTKMNLTVTASLLKLTGVRIDTAESGAEALALTEEKKYDLIFMDQRMPEMDGTETMRRIRRKTDNPNNRIPVICLTADAIIGARERYLAEGFSDYLTKPVDGWRLEEMLLTYLPKEKIRKVTRRETAQEIPKGPSQAAEEETAAGGEDAYASLRAAGIDPESGMAYCQEDGELYRSLLAEYAAEAPEKAETIRRYYSEGNWKDYGILVHALKSSSKLLGAQELSGMAARLEAAAKAGDSGAIRQEHEKMMERYEATAAAICSITPKKETAADPEEIFEFEPEGE